MVEIPLPDPTKVTEEVVQNVLRRPFAEAIALITIGLGFIVLAGTGWMAVHAYREQATETNKAYSDLGAANNRAQAEAREHFGAMKQESDAVQRALLQHLGLKLGAATTGSDTGTAKTN